MKKLLSRLILFYLRRSPIERKKYLIERYFRGLLPSPDIKTIYKNPDGIRFMIENHDYVMNRIFIRGVYERNTIRTVLPLIKDSDGVFIDCGANIGLYSLYLSTFVPKASIHAFEPLQRNLGFLKKNLELNGITSVKVNEFGLSNEEKEIDIFIVDEQNFGRTSEFSDNKDDKSERILLKTLDGYCEENNITELAFIKVDIEGAEFDFIKGAEKIIRASEKLVMLVEINECAYAANYTPEDLFNYIVGLGFDAFIERDYPFAKKKITDNRNYRGNVIFLKK